MIVEVVLFGVLLFLLWKSFSKPPGLPPGRWGLPLVGYIPLTTKTMEEQVMDLHKQYGSVVLWRIGSQPMVFIDDYKLAKEAFSRHEITDRPDWEAVKLLEEFGYGILGSNGIRWHNNRKFTLRQLRDLGMGKSKIVDLIHKQGFKLREAIAKQAGTPEDIPEQLFLTTLNVIWQMVASTQFDAEDERGKEFVKVLTDVMVVITYLTIKDIMPWLKNVMPQFLLHRLTKYHEAYEMKKKLTSYFHEEIERHRSTLNPDKPRDIIDAYLVDMEEKKDDPDTTCSELDLSWVMMNLFFTGTDTTALSFNWLCCYLACHPHVQEKLHAEIDTVLPNGTLPTLAEKSRMPYLEAVINEVMRVSSQVNLGGQHITSAKTELGGYTLPKGTVVSSTSIAIHYSERYWDKPKEFMPERWLDKDGKFNMKEGFLPFGIGKRSCVGESLARMELYIFTAMVFQSFTISPPPGKTIDLTPDLSEFFFRKPRSNKFVFTERK